MHVIDETSPLHGTHIDDLAATETSIVVTVSGLDETSSEFLHARKGYQAKQVLFDRDYVDIVQRDAGGGAWIDYSKFHLTRVVGDAFSREA